MNFITKALIYTLSLSVILLFSCGDEVNQQNAEKKEKFDATQKGGSLFQRVPIKRSGITIKNIVEESKGNNFLVNNLLYSGAGTAIGDFNQDGLPDVAIATNNGQIGVYLNKGDMKFEALGVESGIKRYPGWTSGLSIVDVNADGLDDIYVCRGGTTERNPANKTNLLYINKGNNKFVESAKAYGLADAGVSIQSAFFDYDRDGDLDLYVLNYLPGVQQVPFSKMKKFRNNPDPEILATHSDHLYQNNGGKFTDVSVQSGIANWAHGLGIVIGDVNKDGYPDIYVANDFEVDDFYYQNNKDGTFTEKISENFGHVSFFAMGVDMADINNDTHLDIFEVEMLPKDRTRSVMNMQQMDRGRFEDLLEIGMTNQYMRNCLHINRGNGHFSDVAQYAGVNKTDWSWGTLVIDLDDDGLKDIYVTNGILRDMKNRDFQKNGNELAKQTGGRLSLEQMHGLVPSTKISNYAYKNLDNYAFEDKSKEWGLGEKGFSNAVSYADFDQDGDLDLLVHNLNEEPHLYENKSAQKGNNYLNIKLKGDKSNRKGIGASAKITTEKGLQYQEMYLTRGFQSGSEALLHFGLGGETVVKNLELTWPNGKKQVLADVKANQLLKLDIKDATSNIRVEEDQVKPLFSKSTAKGINFKHQETYFDDFEKEILIPHKMSQNGPFLAVGDVNGDGLEDVFVGGAKAQAGKIFLQDGNNKFAVSSKSSISQDAGYEDMGAAFFDADGDKDLDLYVVSGSNEFSNATSMYQDRLYLNDGKGNFTKSNMLPKITSSGSCVVPNDYDGDGDIDLFVGGRVMPQAYPKTPESMLLINEGGKFVNKTASMANGLDRIGMVTSALWSDYDGDDDNDLIVVGEWMPLSIWENNGGKLSNSEISSLENTGGWWTSLSANDLDGDGDQDYIVGNIGLNHKFKASEEKPFHVYCDDFDNTGSLDIVLAFHQKDKIYPVRGRDCSSEQMPFILDKFPSFEAFGKADLDDVYGDKLNKALHKEAKMFASAVLINENGNFKIKQLPVEAQFSAINGIIAEDFTNNGQTDLLIAGNMFETEAETSRADASIGLLLEGLGNFDFRPLTVKESGFFVPGDVKDIKKIKMKNGELSILVTNNDGPVEVFTLKNDLQ